MPWLRLPSNREPALLAASEYTFELQPLPESWPSARGSLLGVSAVRLRFCEPTLSQSIQCRRVGKTAQARCLWHPRTRGRRQFARRTLEADEPRHRIQHTAIGTYTDSPWPLSFLPARRIIELPKVPFRIKPALLAAIRSGIVQSRAIHRTRRRGPIPGEHPLGVGALR